MSQNRISLTKRKERAKPEGGERKRVGDGERGRGGDREMGEKERN